MQELGKTEKLSQKLLNILLPCVDTCHCDWFNKEADWPIAGQDKVRQASQTENAGRKKCRVASRYKEKQDGHAILRKGTKSCGKT